MFNNRYPWWLRCYPRAFLDRYGGEMLEVIEERKQHEIGVIATVRLWCDLTIDMVISIPRIHLSTRSQMRLETATSNGGLGFQLVDQRSPGVPIFLASIVLSLLLLHSVQAVHPCPNQRELLSYLQLQHAMDRVIAFITR